jgi:hypothetical protein
MYYKRRFTVCTLKGHRVLPLNVRRGKCCLGETIFGYSKNNTIDTTTLHGQTAEDFEVRSPLYYLSIMII